MKTQISCRTATFRSHTDDEPYKINVLFNIVAAGIRAGRGVVAPVRNFPSEELPLGHAELGRGAGLARANVLRKQKRPYGLRRHQLGPLCDDKPLHRALDIIRGVDRPHLCGRPRRFRLFSFVRGRNYPSYHSLRLDATPRSLGEIWNIHRLGESLPLPRRPQRDNCGSRQRGAYARD